MPLNCGCEVQLSKIYRGMIRMSIKPCVEHKPKPKLMCRRKAIQQFKATRNLYLKSGWVEL